MRYSLRDYSITAAQKGWGGGWPVCTAQSQTALVIAPLSGVVLRVHKRIARLVFLLVAETERRGYLLRPGQCWGGACRAIAGTKVPSNHSWWLAVDLNSLANPYVAKKLGRPVTDMPAWLPLLWNAFGFAWGGDYSGSRADAMHEEFMGSPEDADDMTAAAELKLGGPTLGGAIGALPGIERDWFDMATREELTSVVNSELAKVLRAEGVSGAADWGTAQRADGSWPVGAQAKTLIVEGTTEALRSEGVSGAGDTGRFVTAIMAELPTDGSYVSKADVEAATERGVRNVLRAGVGG